MKKILSLLMIISLFGTLCACSNKVNVTYEEDYNKYSEVSPLHEQSGEEKEFLNKIETEESSEYFGEDTNINFIDVKEIKNVLSYGTGVILFANIDTIAEEDKLKLNSFIDSANGANYPINYYKTGDEKNDKKVLKELDGTISDFNSPTIVFLKEGNITGVKNINEIGNNFDDNYQLFKEEVYKTLEE